MDSWWSQKHDDELVKYEISSIFQNLVIEEYNKFIIKGGVGKEGDKTSTVTFNSIMLNVNENDELNSAIYNNNTDSSKVVVTFEQLKMFTINFMRKYKQLSTAYDGWEKFISATQGKDVKLLHDSFIQMLSSRTTEKCDKSLYNFFLFVIYWKIMEMKSGVVINRSGPDPTLEDLESFAKDVKEKNGDMTLDNFWKLYEHVYQKADCEKLKDRVVQSMNVYINVLEGDKRWNGLAHAYTRSLLNSVKKNEEIMYPDDLSSNMLKIFKDIEKSSNMKGFHDIFNKQLENIVLNVTERSKKFHERMKITEFDIVRLQDLVMDIPAMDDIVPDQHTIKMIGFHDPSLHSDFVYAQIFEDCHINLWDPTSLIIYYILRAKEPSDIFTPDFSYIIYQYLMFSQDAEFVQYIDNFFNKVLPNHFVNNTGNIEFHVPTKKEQDRTLSISTENFVDPILKSTSTGDAKELDAKLERLENVRKIKLRNVEDKLENADSNDPNNIKKLKDSIKQLSVDTKQETNLKSKINAANGNITVTVNNGKTDEQLMKERKFIHVSYIPNNDYLGTFTRYVKEMSSHMFKGTKKQDDIMKFFKEVYTPKLQQLSTKCMKKLTEFNNSKGITS